MKTTYDNDVLSKRTMTFAKAFDGGVAIRELSRVLAKFTSLKDMQEADKIEYIRMEISYAKEDGNQEM
jgi:hypothetical protein